MKEMQKKIIDFLEDHKGYFGLSDYKILVAMETYEGEESFAECEPDIFEKRFKVKISKKFLKKDWKEQKNILLHELLHGRFLILDKWKEQVSADLEEDFVNDIIRGFERHKEL
jgi:hypothetical protein